MRRTRCALISALVAMSLLAGCPAALTQLNSGNRAPETQVSPSSAPADYIAPPYVLTARNSGGFVEFSIRNTGSTAVSASASDFALLVRGTRQQVLYDPREVIVDLPSGEISPGQTVSGRIRYLEFGNPTGHRLVFNPGADPKGKGAVFAEIKGPSGSGAEGAESSAPQNS